MNLTSKIRRALNELDLSPLQFGVDVVGILHGRGGLRRGDTLSCLQNLISPTPHHASISTLYIEVEPANSKSFGLNGYSERSEESPSSKSLEVEKFRSLEEVTVIQSP